MSADANLELSSLVSKYFPVSVNSRELADWTISPVPEWSGPTDDDVLIAKMLSSGSTKQAFTGACTFSDLWNANVPVLSANYPDPKRDYDASSADAALASHLAFWTGKDCSRMEHLMRRSALIRPKKWDRRERPPGYLKTTIMKAVTYCTDVYGSRSANGPAPPPPPNRSLRTTTAADIKPTIIEWIWEGVLAKGKITTIAGDPGVGKGVLTTFMASHISNGRDWKAGQPCRKGTVAFLAQEDSKADTVVPRLMAAEADLTRVKFIDGVMVPNVQGDVPFNLDQSSALLDTWLEENPDVTVLIIDPINDFLGPSTDSYKDADVRQTLNPLKIMAEKNGVAVVMISHMNKGNAKADYRIMGAMAFTGIARLTFVMIKSKEDPDLRLMLPVKANITKDTIGYGYRIQERRVPIEGVPAPQPLFVLDDAPVNRTAQQELNEGGPRDNLGDDIRKFLRTELGSGTVLANEMKKRCENAGLSYATVNKRKKHFGVESRKENPFDNKSPWVWVLVDSRTGG